MLFTSYWIVENVWGSEPICRKKAAKNIAVLSKRVNIR